MIDDYRQLLLSKRGLSLGCRMQMMEDDRGCAECMKEAYGPFYATPTEVGLDDIRDMIRLMQNLHYRGWLTADCIYF